MADLSIQGVTKQYASGVQALWPTDLQVQDGELVVFVGPSGCGKSTLLKIIAGLEQATSGSISLDGLRVDNIAPKDRDVAMVFQNYALYPHLNVGGNLAFGLKMRGMGAAERAREVESVARLLQLTDLLDRRPSQLSGGQQQRVALGRAIVRRPKVFLLDEPFSNLDATLRAGTRTELLKLHRELKATTVLVTHDQVEAMTMADRLVVMKDGRIQQIGAPLDVYRNPANEFVGRFIGFPPMNLLPARSLSGGLTWDIAGQRIPNPLPALQVTTPLTLGVRAEHLHVVGTRKDSATGTLSATVGFFEPLGHEIICTCFMGGLDVAFRLPPTTPLRAGQEVQLDIEWEHVCLFHPETGARIPGCSFQTASGDALDEVALQTKK